MMLHRCTKNFQFKFPSSSSNWLVGAVFDQENHLPNAHTSLIFSCCLFTSFQIKSWLPRLSALCSHLSMVWHKYSSIAQQESKCCWILRFSACSDALIIKLHLFSCLYLRGHGHSAAPVSMLAHYHPTTGNVCEHLDGSARTKKAFVWFLTCGSSCGFSCLSYM